MFGAPAERSVLVDEYVEPCISLRWSEELYRREESINIRSLRDWASGFRSVVEETRTCELCRWGRRKIRQRNTVHCFPIIGRHHLDRIPGTAVQECSVWSLTNALLAANTKIRIYLDSSEWRMIFIRHPEHARFDRTILDASWRSGAAGAAVSCDCKDSRALFSGGLAVAL